MCVIPPKPEIAYISSRCSLLFGEIVPKRSPFFNPNLTRALAIFLAFLPIFFHVLFSTLPFTSTDITSV